jgi:hypothetical protein
VTASLVTPFDSALIDPTLSESADNSTPAPPVEQFVVEESSAIEEAEERTFDSADAPPHGGFCTTTGCPGLRTIRWGNKWKRFCPGCLAPPENMVPTSRALSSGRQAKASQKVLYEVETGNSKKRKADGGLARKERATRARRRDQEIEAELEQIWEMEQVDIDD